MFSKLTTLTLALTILLVSCNTFSPAPGSPVLISPENKAKVDWKFPIPIELIVEASPDCISILIEVSTSQDFEPYYTVTENSPSAIIITDEKTVWTYQVMPFGSESDYEPGKQCIAYYWRAYAYDSDGNWSEPSEVWKFTVEFTVEEL